jgi:hypothetical protein
VPLQASAEPGRAEASVDGNGVTLPAGDGDVSDPALGAADARALALGEAPGSEDAPGEAGDPLASGGAVGLAPHAATSTATPSIATIRVARPGFGRVMATPGA